MHNVHYRKFDIKNEDTLEHPQHIEMRFDAIVANPPFSAKWSASPLFMSDDRFSSYGKLAPSSKADFAFVQHMVHQLDDKGTMAVVLPHGVLFRGAAEGHIRKYLIQERNCLDAVIGLPANVFYGTSIPTCILVMKKKREMPWRSGIPSGRFLREPSTRCRGILSVVRDQRRQLAPDTRGKD